MSVGSGVKKAKGERTIPAVRASHFLTNMSIALYPWSRTALESRDGDERPTHDAKEPERVPFPIDQADGHGGNDLSREILLLVAVRGSHERHEARDARVHERVAQGARERGHEHLAVRTRL